MKSIILAAGRGSRLSPLSDFRHKALLEVGKTPILEHQISNLQRFGIEEISVVTGYKNSTVNKLCRELENKSKNINISTIYNENWESTENLYSLSLTEELVRGDPLIILNCDIFPEEDIFNKITKPEENIIPYDPSETDDDALQLKLNSDRKPVEILDKGDPKGDGATLGMVSLNGSASDALFADINMYLDQDDVRAFWFEHSISRLFSEYKFNPLNVENLEWFEIDTEEDLRESSRELGQTTEEINLYISDILG